MPRLFFSRPIAHVLRHIDDKMVLAGLGWRRTQDALGPAVRDSDGRVFTVQTLPGMMTVEPFPGLRC